MKKNVFLAFTNSTIRREQEYNKWYDEQHLVDVINVPGFVSARRYRHRLAPGQFEFNTQTLEHKYLALYEIETDDIVKVMKELAFRVGTPEVVTTDAIDTSTLRSPVFEQIIERQDAFEVQRRRIGPR
jgi:hypothetical protein